MVPPFVLLQKVSQSVKSRCIYLVELVLKYVFMMCMGFNAVVILRTIEVLNTIFDM